MNAHVATVAVRLILSACAALLSLPVLAVDYSVGGTITGLTQPGLVLRLTYDPPAACIGNGGTYQLPLDTPGGCTSVAVGCCPGLVTFSGTVNGMLQCTCGTVIGAVPGWARPKNASALDATEDLPVAANATSFTFPVPIPNGSTYTVSVFAQPLHQICTVANGSGTVNGADVTNVAVTCITIVPPTVTKSFSPPEVSLGGTATVTFAVSNPNASAASGIGFTDLLPAGLVVATPNGAGGTCNGTTTATAGSNSISLSGASLAASGGCTVLVNVTGITAGGWNNTTGPVASTEGGSGAPSNTATLAVVAPPVIAKSFDRGQVAFNESAVLSFTLTNPAANTVALTNVGFTDNLLPSGLQVASPSGLTSSCGGAVTAVSGGDSISLVGGTIPAAGSCTISVNVVPVTYGVGVNTVTVTSGNGGTGNTSSTSIALPQRAIPVMQGWTLLLLVLVVGSFAAVGLYRRRQLLSRRSAES